MRSTAPAAPRVPSPMRPGLVSSNCSGATGSTNRWSTATVLISLSVMSEGRATSGISAKTSADAIAIESPPSDAAPISGVVTSSTATSSITSSGSTSAAGGSLTMTIDSGSRYSVVGIMANPSIRIKLTSVLPADATNASEGANGSNPPAAIGPAPPRAGGASLSLRSVGRIADAGQNGGVSSDASASASLASVIRSLIPLPPPPDFLPSPTIR